MAYRPDPLPIITYDVIVDGTVVNDVLVGGTVVGSYPWEMQRLARDGNPAYRRATMHADLVGGTVRIGWLP